MLHDIKNVGRKCGKTFFFGQNVVEEKKVCANWTANVSNVGADTSI